MTRVVVLGGGVIGLSTAMLLGRDGHDVVVVERDAAEPDGDHVALWSSWERRGVSQFRLLHYFQPGFRVQLERELPEVAGALDAAGAIRHNVIALVPAELTGGFREGDEQYEALTARRPVMEAVLARAARSTPGVEIRRGVAVEGLVTGTPAEPGTPHVTGVRTASGEVIRGDLVVDALGRRSPLASWLQAAGARPPAEEREDCGFVYYCRHFRSADGSVPALIAPLLQDYGSVSILTLPADNGTWGVGFVASSKDKPARALKDAATWHRAIAAFPLAAHWADAEPIDERVTVIAGIEDRHRDYCPGGSPVATGVVSVGDSWACTNPSLGRGAAIGLLHAVALRDLMRGDVAGDPPQARPWLRPGDCRPRRGLVPLHPGLRPGPAGGDERRDRGRGPRRRSRVGADPGAGFGRRQGWRDAARPAPHRRGAGAQRPGAECSGGRRAGDRAGSGLARRAEARTEPRRAVADPGRVR